MPEYLAPGVYVEETSFRSKSIEGVSTTTTGFVGPTLYGPISDEPEILTSLLDFERTYGRGDRLRFTNDNQNLKDNPDLTLDAFNNYMWHAVRSFFENGGARVYVKRVYRGVLLEKLVDGALDGPRDEGRASNFVGRSTDNAGKPRADGLQVAARHPGVAGARRVRLTLSRSPNVLSTVVVGGNVQARYLRNVTDGDVLLVAHTTAPDKTKNTWTVATSSTNPDGSLEWAFSKPIAGGETLKFGDLDPAEYDVSVVSLAVTDSPGGADERTWLGLPLDPAHRRGDAGDSVFDKFSTAPARRSDRTDLPITIERQDETKLVSGIDVLTALFRETLPLPDPKDGAIANPAPTKPEDSWLATNLATRNSTPLERSFAFDLAGGLDGVRPVAGDYEGTADPDSTDKTGLKSFEDLEDISIVAAPGSTFGYDTEYQTDSDAIIQQLIGHCERMRYRIAVLDSGQGQTISAVRKMRGGIDSKHAALYYPWVMVLDPITQAEIPLPPSGFVTGIYARNDRLRAVYKAPANEVVTGALRFEVMLNRSQQEVLNPEGVNCFRFFEGRGNRLWGARTISSDPEWKYVNLRRYFAYLERSIDIGTQWAVFEPNGEMLWGNVRRTIEDFLFNEFQMGALLGDKPEKAYFVKCDRSTMTQNDLDNGRLVCLIGVAPLRPAEFVIFRIGQWTADRRV